MAKKSSIEKNNRRRKLAKKFSGRRSRLKAIARDKALPTEERVAAALKLAQLPRNSSSTRIRNPQMRNNSKVSTPGSTLRARVLDVLKSEGYIRGYSTVEYGNRRTEFEVELKYFDGEPVIREIARVSKPGRRVYASVKTLPRINNGLGVSILSTPKGVMADHDARDQNVGGEILCTVF